MEQIEVIGKMTPEQFCYWLQGFVDCDSPNYPGLSQEQWLIIKDRLNLVFNKITPLRYVDDDPNFSLFKYGVPKVTC